MESAAQYSYAPGMHLPGAFLHTYMHSNITGIAYQHIFHSKAHIGFTSDLHLDGHFNSQALAEKRLMEELQAMSLVRHTFQ